jgi:hypothetical protein
VNESASQDTLVLVFERGGFVYAYSSLEEAAESIESLDLEQGNYVGAFTDLGEVIDMRPAGLFASFTRTGRSEPIALASLIKQSRGPQELADRAHEYATAILQRGGSC